ncbi:MAG TPA: LamG domain-containing protein [Thermotoga sp.]|jgi:hypothetical protein|uniref:LamG domain-containing protein n=1 Tax=Thermotoga sp. (strain RQ2) TaxID=126740 RepID=UPI00001B5BE3|nr:LamG domain-containing protein [Thermotoga sp. RQ2]ACB09016.1 conserved hypothetical protein [Thermotoga sp. RQ2]CAD67953.1 hypothetical protein [Thermotoga sp. RQ2]HBF69143.1 LamG domain-containing protein [Thermotoga sp.]
MRKVLFLFTLTVLLVVGFAFDPNNDPSLIAYFPFDGSLKDATGHFGEVVKTGRTIGSVGRGQITFVDGVVGQAVKLPGSRGLLLPEDLIKDYDYTVAFWVYANKLTRFTTTFFGAYIDKDLKIHWISFVPLCWNNGTMLWARDEAQNVWYDGILSKNIEPGKWYHVAISVLNGIVRVYINGEQVLTKIQINGQENLNGKLPDVFSLKPGGVFALGANYWDAPFDGMFDELRIYDRPLGPDEVRILYNYGR